MTLGLWIAQVAFMLQPRWSHPFWQVHLQNLCTNIHLYGHSDQHDQIILSKKHNPNLKIDDSRVVECSGCIYVLSKVAPPFLVGVFAAILYKLALLWAQWPA